MALRVNYDEIAPTFDARYTIGLYDGVLGALRELAGKNREFVLEAGCGTGYWLSALRDVLPHIYGLDYSLEMLRKAGTGTQPAGLSALWLSYCLFAAELST